MLGIHSVFFCSIFCCLMKPVNGYSWGGRVAKYINFYLVLNNLLSRIIPFEPQKVQEVSIVFSNAETVFVVYVVQWC